MKSMQNGRFQERLTMVSSIHGMNTTLSPLTPLSSLLPSKSGKEIAMFNSEKYWIKPTMQYFTLFRDMLGQKHLLIAGATGSGKSVLVNGLIYTALQYSPNEVQFILIDPKGVELQDYQDLPHTIKYAYEPSDMMKALEMGLNIMLERFSNMKKRREKDYKGGHLYIIIDEFADLMTTSKKQVTPIIQRIGQLGRAAHVHMIACTQCPLAKVIPTEIKVNFDSIIGLRTATAQHSRNIIDAKGCENLPDPRAAGKGYGYYRKGANLTLYEIPMQPPEQIAEIVDYWKQQKPRSKSWLVNHGYRV